MRTKLIESNKPEKYIHSVRNIDGGSVSSISTVQNSIAQGTPVILSLGQVPNPSAYQNGLPAGFEDGLDVVLPATAAGNVNFGSGSLFALNTFHYGVAVGNINYNALGEVMVHGVYPYALFVRATRASTTSSWTSSASLAGYQQLSIDTINNAYTTIAASASAASSSGTFYTNPFPPLPVYLMDSVASMSASASNTSDTRTAIITQQRVFIREM
jgi:hypothetical protein